MTSSRGCEDVNERTADVEHTADQGGSTDVDRSTFMFDRQWLQAGLLALLVPGYDRNPDAALAAAGDRLGVGRVPLFDPSWYRSRYGLPPDTDAFTHYLQTGVSQGLDPHPLFSTPYYVAQAPEAGAPGVNPLQHFLSVGGRMGLDCHPLFFAEWYWQAYPDIRAAGMAPLLHFLQFGGRELRDPSPVFSSRYYASQHADAAAAANPLVHYVCFGAEMNLRPHPGFRPEAIARTFARTGSAPLEQYLAVVGRQQAARAVPASPVPEPGIRPSSLATFVSAPGDATQKGMMLLRTSAPLPKMPRGAQAAYQLAKLNAVQETPGLPAELAAAMVQGGPEAEMLLQSVGLLPSRHPLPPDPPQGPEGILDRYSAMLFSAAQRFRLDPAHAGSAPGGIVISILMPVHRPPLHILERAILSVMCQTYPDWELCLVDDGSGQPGLTAALAGFAARDSRIKLVSLRKGTGISAASNRALAMATGPYAGLLDHDDMLTADALETVAATLAKQPCVDLVYSDECRIDGDDVPESLFTKPDWSPALLTSFMYTGHFSVYRTVLVRDLGGFRSQFDFSQDYDLALRVAELDPAVTHIRKVLYGWRMIEGSGAMGGKPHARTSNIGALQSAMDRRGWAGTAVALPTSNRAVFDLPDPAPLISVIVPSDDAAHILQTVMSVVAHTSYPAYEIIVVARSAVVAECGAALRPGQVRFAPYDKPFNFSDKCNVGAKAARGSHLVFLNDDVRVLTLDWLQALLECLSMPGVGAAAPKLLYEDGTIQHAGMITGTRRLVSTAFHCFPAGTSAHFNMAQSVRDVSLLSGACLAVPATIFRDLGGFDAVHAPVAHSDVDLCLRLREAGLRCVYTPHAELTHIGHASIGATEREFRQDKADIMLMRRFGPALEQDPFFPPAMHGLLATGDQQPFRYHAAPRTGTGRSRAGRDALLVSHDLSASGAPRVAYDMARSLVAAGWHVLVMSPVDGPYREKLLDAGADVIIEPGVLAADPAVLELARNFDVVIGNTVLCWRLMPALVPFTRVFLYSHETELIAHLRGLEPGFVDALKSATRIWTASPRSAAPLLAIGIEPRMLAYGISPAGARKTPNINSTVHVSVFGTFEPRKGQDLAIKAFPLLPPELQAKCRLQLNGRVNDEGFASALHVLSAGMPNVVLGPELTVDECQVALMDADIILCPSRDDTLPLVSLDALAAGKILICSAEVGTSAFIEDGVSGFVVRHNAPEEIAAVLARVVAARKRWPQIGAAARLVFEQNFSVPRFERRLLSLLDVAPSAARAAE